MSLVPLEADIATAASAHKCPPRAWEKPKLRGYRPRIPLGATNSETLLLFYGLDLISLDPSTTRGCWWLDIAEAGFP